MKRLPQLLLLVCAILCSCNSKPKSNIEIKFNDYIASIYGDNNALENISYIEKTDSTDVLELVKSTLNATQQLNSDFPEAVDSLMSEYDKATSAKQMQFRSIMSDLYPEVSQLIELSKAHAYDELWLRKIYEESDTTKAIQRQYIIKANVKGKGETEYYAIDYALNDTVMFYRSKPTTDQMLDEAQNIVNLGNTLTDFNLKRTKTISKMYSLINGLRQ